MDFIVDLVTFFTTGFPGFVTILVFIGLGLFDIVENGR